MFRLITTARLNRLTDAARRAKGARMDAEGADRARRAAVADTERVEDAYRRLCKDNVGLREAAVDRAADVRLAAFDIVAALIDDRLDDDERRQQLARLLVARRELLGLDAMPGPIWRHVADIARKTGETNEETAEGGEDSPADVAPPLTPAG